MKKIIMMGSIWAAVIVVLMTFTSIVNAQMTKTTIQNVISEIQTRKSINNGLPLFQKNKTFDPYALWDLLTALFSIFLYMIIQFSLNHPPSS